MTPEERLDQYDKFMVFGGNQCIRLVRARIDKLLARQKELVKSKHPWDADALRGVRVELRTLNKTLDDLVGLKVEKQKVEVPK